MNRRTWTHTAVLSPALIQRSSGHYHAHLHGMACQLTLRLRPGGQLSGEVHTDGEVLWLVGGISGPQGAGYGFLLEPESRAIVALFRVQLGTGHFTLALDVPDFSEQFSLGHAETVRFERWGALGRTCPPPPPTEVS